jgi:tRNA1(Val) A37 N6-methylase TrmN6
MNGTYYTPNKIKSIIINPPFMEYNHYNNEQGSLYKFAEHHELNAYEFDAIKRLVRCRKKGQWLSDIEKTIKVLEIYKEEMKHLHNVL